MESTVGVALATKLLKLFPYGEEKFLSFPMSGMAFTRDELDFLSDDQGISASEIREKMMHKSQFARLLNLIPADSVVYAPSDSLLWSEYASILETARLAQTLLTPDEMAMLDKADNFLTDERVVDGNKVRVYSVVLEKYYEYKTDYEEIERTFLDEDLMSKGLEGSEKVKWETIRKPELQTLKEKALSDWKLLGRKEEVEDYQRTRMRLSGKIPRRYLVDDLNNFEACREVDLLTNDPIGTYSTFYSPSDCFEPSVGWINLHLTKAEIDGLVKEAPAELKKYATGGIHDIESIQLEYAKIVIIRPWFDSELFYSRYWNLPEGTGSISDGSLPRQGRIPAFITNMIAARKISIQHIRPTSPSETRAALKPDKMHIMKVMGPALSTVDKTWKVKVSGKTQRIKQKAISRQAPILRADNIARARGVLTRRPTSSSGRHPSPTPSIMRVSLPVAARNKAFIRAKMDGTTIKRKPVSLRPIQVVGSLPPLSANKERVTEEVTLDGVVVIALVCRRIPKCPDPDPGLVWD